MAIQISGTTVVNNSRQLQNIASLDSTTISTISSAGIGGGWTLQSNTTPSQTSSIQITLQNTKINRIVLLGVECPQGGGTYAVVRTKRSGQSSFDASGYTNMGGAYQTGTTGHGLHDGTTILSGTNGAFSVIDLYDVGSTTSEKLMVSWTSRANNNPDNNMSVRQGNTEALSQIEIFPFNRSFGLTMGGGRILHYTGD
jgi:hypothetical protein